MKKYILSAIIAVAAVGANAQVATWNVDNAHSAIRFSVTHMVVSETEGTFKASSGKIEASKADFTDAKINFVVDAKSINTENEMRDGHLKSADFFDVEKYPQITFTGVKFTKKDAKNYVLEGDLTLHGVTKRVKFDVVYGGTTKDPYGNTKAGFKATTVIDRTQYGLTWSKTNAAGELAVGNDVTITLKLEFAKAS